MATKRMFSKSVICSDKFYSMSDKSRLLYIGLSMVADDDGIVDSSNMVMRLEGATLEHLQELIDIGYIIPLDGVIIIAHWHINNYLRKDRYKPTLYRETLEKLKIHNDIYAYGIPTVNQRSTQVRKEKDSIGEIRGDKGEIPPGTAPTPYGDFNRVKLTGAEYKTLVDKYGENITADYIRKADRAGENKSRDIDKPVLYISGMIEKDYTPQEIEQKKKQNKTNSKLYDLEKYYLCN